MALHWYSTVIRCRDPMALARFWAAVLGYEVVYVGGHEVDIAPDRKSFPGLVFVSATSDGPDPPGPGRALHLDLCPDDQAQEVDRLIGLGAKRADVGQPPDAPWVVLEDPEGNVFCVLEPQPGWDPPPHHT